eukprot:Opistho-2@8522
METSDLAKGRETTENDMSQSIDESAADLEHASSEEGSSSAAITDAAAPLSKNQRKKIAREQKWEAKREQRKETRRQHRIARKERQREEKAVAVAAVAGTDGASGDGGNASTAAPPPKRFKKMADAVNSPTVVVDLGFDDLMTARDVKHLVTQVARCYSANRRSTNPFRFHLTSMGGKAKEHLAAIHGSEQWDVIVDTRPYEEVFARDSLVYLSSESSNVIMSLDPAKVYVIGGLVDHNHHKGLTFRLAQEKGIAHGQLPIGEYVRMQSRKVLTVNHVFEILSKYEEMKDWKAAFLSVIPQRKFAQNNHQNGGGAEDASSEVQPDASESALQPDAGESEVQPDAGESKVCSEKVAVQAPSPSS